MRVRDFLLLVAVCLIWAFNNVLSKIIVTDWGIPPLFTPRCVLLAWRWSCGRGCCPASRIVAIALCLGGGSFSLLFVGLQTVSPSEAAIILQLGVPFTMLLSALVLSERATVALR